jgi:predicted DCC family thiol-disulfide oxidoreductase YuxK
VDEQGRLHVGIDAAALLWKRTPGQAWLAAAARHPLIRPLAVFVYDRIISAAFHRWAEHRLARRARPPKVPPGVNTAASACGIGVYYNGACPVCGPEIDRLRSAARRGAVSFAWHDLAARPEALAARGVGAEAARRRLHAVDAHGALHVGIDAFALIWEQLPRYRWLAVLVRLPVLHGVAAAVYDRALAPALAALNARALHKERTP